MVNHKDLCEALDEICLAFDAISKENDKLSPWTVGQCNTARVMLNRFEYILEQERNIMTETTFTKAYKALKTIDDAHLSNTEHGVKITLGDQCAHIISEGIEIGEFFWQDIRTLYDALEKLKILEFDEMVDNSLASGIFEEPLYDFLKNLKEQISSRHPMSAEADRIIENEIFDELEKMSNDLDNSTLEISGVTSMENMFRDCSSYNDEWKAYGKRQNEDLTDQILRLKQLKNGLQNDNYYGCPIDDDFEALEAGIEALENRRHEALKRFKK